MATIINESHLGIILELLAPFAYKWKKIGIALGFTLSELQVIDTAKPPLYFGTPNSWLREMLSMWVQWTPETLHGKYSTLEDLVKALKSEIVELAGVAEKVEEAITGICIYICICILIPCILAKISAMS